VAACNPIHSAVLRFDRVQRALAMGKLPDLEDCKAYSAAMATAAASAGQERPLSTERALRCPDDWREQLRRLNFETTLRGWIEADNLSPKQAFDILSRYFNRRWSVDRDRGRPSLAEHDLPFLLISLHGGLPSYRHICEVLKRLSV
jgi:hypothetical protein